MRRTKASLHEALITLAREQPYDSIAVKDVLKRADVGRSTFYEHFRDKDDLLDSGIHDVIRSLYCQRHTGSTIDRIVGFSRPLLEHIASHRTDGGRGMTVNSRLAMHGRLQVVLAALIIDDAKGLRRGQLTPPVASELLAQQIASTFVLVLTWWLERHPDLTPTEVDAQFQAMVLPMLREL